MDFTLTQKHIGCNPKTNKDLHSFCYKDKEGNEYSYNSFTFLMQTKTFNGVPLIEADIITEREPTYDVESINFVEIEADYHPYSPLDLYAAYRRYMTVTMIPHVTDFAAWLSISQRELIEAVHLYFGSEKVFKAFLAQLRQRYKHLCYAGVISHDLANDFFIRSGSRMRVTKNDYASRRYYVKDSYEYTYEKSFICR